jgi:hypothetical protein
MDSLPHIIGALFILPMLGTAPPFLVVALLRNGWQAWREDAAFVARARLARGRR